MDPQPRIKVVRTHSRKIKTGLPLYRAELRRILPTAQRKTDDLGPYSPPDAFDEAADSMWRVVLCARNIADHRTPSGCTVHPDAVDPVPKPGWSSCLICNTWRSRGRPDRVSATDPGPGWESFSVASAEQGIEILGRVMYELNERAHNLRLESSWPDRAALAHVALQAFMLLREMSRPPARTGCVLHPETVDENPPPGWGRCLICNTKRHKEMRGTQTGRLQEALPASRAKAIRHARQEAARAQQRPLAPAPRVEQESGEDERARQIAALQKLIDQDRSGGDS